MNYLKKILLSHLLFLMGVISSSAQSNLCGTKSPDKLRHVTPDMMRNPAMDDPIMIRLFVHICANSDGSGAVVSADSVRIALAFIENFFEPHGICFILGGIDQVNNTDLVSVDDDDEDLLLQYLIPGCIDIFVHDQLFIDGESFGGRSWDIPNTYMSITNNHMNGTNHPLCAHELGHCLGLYHTHEDTGGSELVNRTGICSNCSIAGDLLCDTPADPYIDGDLNNHVTNCVYTGSAEDACDESFAPDVLNIMSYAPVACWDYFTNQQGARMRSFALNDSDLEECVSPSSVIFSVSTNTVVFDGWAIHTAHNDIVVQAQNYEIVGTAHGFFGAQATTILQHVHFAPSTGYVHITPRNPLCD
jgi:hypothetical protein